MRSPWLHNADSPGDAACTRGARHATPPGLYASKSTWGFTLVEVLIVAAIISVVAALLFPVGQRAMESSRRVKCASNLREIGNAIRLHLADHNNLYPAANAAKDSAVANSLGWYGLWYIPTAPANGGLIPYVGSQAAMDKLIVCPENIYVTDTRPSIKSPIGFPYSANYNVLVASGAAKARNSLSIAQPSQMVLMADSATGATPGTAWGLGVNSTTSGWAALENRHAEKMNILWADGHVTTGKKETDITDLNLK